MGLRAISSAVERLPYKQDVAGSNPASRIHPIPAPLEAEQLPMQACRLWAGNYNVESGLYRLPDGLTIPFHHHPCWSQVFVVSGAMNVQDVGEEPHRIAAGGLRWLVPKPKAVAMACQELALHPVLLDPPRKRRGMRAAPACASGCCAARRLRAPHRRSRR
jgi:hypothetical protein